jgi:hypothetical protein
VAAREQVARLLCEGREGRVGAEEADDNAGADPGRQVVLVDQHGDRQSGQEAAGHVEAISRRGG